MLPKFSTHMRKQKHKKPIAHQDLKNSFSNKEKMFHPHQTNHLIQ